MHAPCNQRRSLETGLSERQKKKKSLRALEAEDARDLGQAAKKRNIRPGVLKMIGLKRPPPNDGNGNIEDKLHRYSKKRPGAQQWHVCLLFVY
ncbi:hypothetical protein V8C40DRAFT_237178 [Trichoderma camerunense]